MKIKRKWKDTNTLERRYYNDLFRGFVCGNDNIKERMIHNELV